VRLATDAGIAADRVSAPGFADDVDTPADLERLQHGSAGGCHGTGAGQPRPATARRRLNRPWQPAARPSRATGRAAARPACPDGLSASTGLPDEPGACERADGERREQQHDQRHPALGGLARTIDHLGAAEDPGEVDRLGIGRGEDAEHDQQEHDHDPADLLGHGRAGLLVLRPCLRALRGRRVGRAGGLAALARSSTAGSLGAVLGLLLHRSPFRSIVVGPSGTLAHARGVPTACRSRLSFATASTYEESWMPQGTVKHFDPGTGTGSLVQDDLVERDIDREAFTASRLMELRVGQRVRFELEQDGDDERVTQLNIISL
jgi:cold shock CspA family protein